MLKYAAQSIEFHRVASTMPIHQGGGQVTI